MPFNLETITIDVPDGAEPTMLILPEIAELDEGELLLSKLSFKTVKVPIVCLIGIAVAFCPGRGVETIVIEGAGDAEDMGKDSTDACC